MRTILLFLSVMAVFAPNAWTLTVGTTNIYTHAAYLIKWTDDDGLPRSAALVQTGAPNSLAGVIQWMTYLSNAGGRQVVITPPSTDGSGGAFNSGFGSSVHHNGIHKASGTLTLRWQGDHAAIFDYVQTLSGAIETITYTFRDGRDDIQWADTVDTRLGTAAADSRGPYCTMNWDGGTGFDTADGMEYAANGFVSMPVITGGGANLLTGVWSNWGRIRPGFPDGDVHIPFCREWDKGFEVGYVQSQTYGQQLAGDPTWSCSANMSNAARFSYKGVRIDPTIGPNWAFDFQMNIYDGAKKITWGMPYGYMNHTPSNPDYLGVPRDGTKNQWGQYSLSCVFDTLSEGGVRAIRNENAAIQSNRISLTCAVGSVVPTGPVGTKNTNNLQPLVPAGWDHNYRAWWLKSAGQALSFDMNLSAGTTLENPCFRLRGLDALPPSFLLNGAPLAEGTDYYASPYPGVTNEVWVTLLRTLTGNNSFLVSSGGALPAVSLSAYFSTNFNRTELVWLKALAPGALTYAVEKSPAGKAVTTNASGSATNWLDVSVDRGRDYGYRILTYTNGAYCGASQVLRFEVPPFTIAGFEAVFDTNRRDRVVLSWDPLPIGPAVEYRFVRIVSNRTTTNAAGTGASAVDTNPDWTASSVSYRLLAYTNGLRIGASAVRTVALPRLDLRVELRGNYLRTSQGEDHAEILILVPEDRTAISIDTYNTAGERVKSFARTVDAGPLVVDWKAEGDGGAELASGVYIAVIRIGKEKPVRRKIMIVK